MRKLATWYKNVFGTKYWRWVMALDIVAFLGGIVVAWMLIVK